MAKTPKNARIDFHLHVTTGSEDAKNNLFDLFYYCLRNNVLFGSITDHNNIDSWYEMCRVFGKDPASSHIVQDGVTMISGVEMDCSIPFSVNGTNILTHCQVLGANLENKYLHKLITMKSLDDRHLHMCIKISQLLHFVSFKDEKTKKKAFAMLDTLFNKADLEPGDIDFIFTSFMKDNKIPTLTSHRKVYDMNTHFFPRLQISPEDLCKFAHVAGGHVVWAHPGIQLLFSDNKQEIIDYMINSGIDGAEILYNNTQSDVNSLIQDSVGRHGRTDFIYTGGSDNHDSPLEVGTIKIPKIGQKNCLVADFQPTIDALLSGHKVESDSSLNNLLVQYEKQFKSLRKRRNQMLKTAMVSIKDGVSTSTSPELLEEIPKFFANYSLEDENNLTD